MVEKPNIVSSALSFRSPAYRSRLRILMRSWESVLFADRGVLFANSGKKYPKNAAKTKVLESFPLQERVFYRIKTCMRLKHIPTAASGRLWPSAGEEQKRALFFDILRAVAPAIVQPVKKG